MNDKSKPIVIPAEKMEEFKKLTSIPKISYVPIFIGVIATINYFLSIYLGFTGVIPLWAASIMMALGIYANFSPIHDAIHRSLSTNVAFNDNFASLIVFLGGPYTGGKPGLEFFRWFHMEHHRFTNGEDDPDAYVHGSWATMWFRWMTIDIYYAVRAIQSGGEKGKALLKKTIIPSILFFIFIAFAIQQGYGKEFLFLWVIPTRLGVLMWGFTFFWLPHAHSGKTETSVVQSENLTQATTVRFGFDSLMNVLLQGQNYHLIHHLWPTTPCYNNRKVFKLLEPELRARGLAVQHNFDIMPELVEGRAV